MTKDHQARMMHRFSSRSDEDAGLTRRARAPVCGSCNAVRVDEFVAAVENLCIVRAVVINGSSKNRMRNLTRQLLSGLCLLALLTGLGCARRPPPAPRSEAPQTPTAAPTSDPSVMPGPAPELDVLIVPSLILEGESAMLSWEARNSDRVIINNNIGLVDISGRIKLFPDETTSYDVIAEGLGGRIAKTIIVEVFKDDTLSMDELEALPLEEQFDHFVKPVFFPYDSAVLSEEASLRLEESAGWLTRPENLGIHFLIEGHCDQRGTEEYNLALGDTRAQAVRAYLAEQGVDLSRLRALSLGEERPFDLRQTEEGWRLNRRVHFVLTQ